MDTTYSPAAETKAAPVVTEEKKNNRKAIVGFGSGAAIVFGAAIYYCMHTGHTFEAGLISGLVVIVAGFAA